MLNFCISNLKMFLFFLFDLCLNRPVWEKMPLADLLEIFFIFWVFFFFGVQWGRAGDQGYVWCLKTVFCMQDNLHEMSNTKFVIHWYHMGKNTLFYGPKNGIILRWKFVYFSFLSFFLLFFFFDVIAWLNPLSAKKNSRADDKLFLFLIFQRK